MAQEAGRKDEPSLGQLFSELSHETSALVRQEIALARAEMTQKLNTVTKDIVSVAAGGAIAYAGLLTVIAAIIIALNRAADVSIVAASVSVALIVLVIGVVLLMKGLQHLKGVDVAPRQTLGTLKEDLKWAKDQMS